jgi:hypothetical protein
MPTRFPPRGQGAQAPLPETRDEDKTREQLQRDRPIDLRDRAWEGFDQPAPRGFDR